MKIKTITDKIKELEKEINFRDDSKEWQNKNTISSFDSNEYFWRHCGIRDNYKGRLEALKELITLDKQNKPKVKQ